MKPILPLLAALVLSGPAASQSITTRPLPPVKGGTGVNNLTLNGILLGQGENSVTFITGTAGQFLVPAVGGVPGFVTLTGDVTGSTSTPGEVIIGSGKVTSDKILDLTIDAGDLAIDDYSGKLMGGPYGVSITGDVLHLMDTPGQPTATAGTAGSLASGTYYYVIAATDGIGATVGGTERSVAVTGPNGSVALSWTAVPGAVGYRVYRGEAADAQDTWYSTATNSFTDTGAAGTAGTVPEVTGAYVHKFAETGNSWMLSGNLGIGVSNPAYPLVASGSGLYGMVGVTSSTNGESAGIYGENTGATGSVQGVYGRATNSTTGVGVWGVGYGAGVYGTAMGVDGQALVGDNSAAGTAAYLETRGTVTGSSDLPTLLVQRSTDGSGTMNGDLVRISDASTTATTAGNLLSGAVDGLDVFAISRTGAGAFQGGVSAVGSTASGLTVTQTGASGTTPVASISRVASSNGTGAVLTLDDSGASMTGDLLQARSNSVTVASISANGTGAFSDLKIGTSSTDGYVWTATDASGNGAWEAATGGAAPSTTNLLAGNGSGGFADAGVAASALAKLSVANTFTANQRVENAGGTAAVTIEPTKISFWNDGPVTSTITQETNGTLTVSQNLALGGSSHVLANTDARGTATVPTSGSTVAVTFTTAYATAPIVVVTPTEDLSGERVLYYWVTATTTGFTISTDSNPTNNGLTFNYMVMG